MIIECMEGIIEIHEVEKCHSEEDENIIINLLGQTDTNSMNNSIYFFYLRPYYPKREYRKKLDSKDKLRVNKTESRGVKSEHKMEEKNDKISDEEKKKRCKNWPNCKNENCEYHHPKETVKFYLI